MWYTLKNLTPLIDAVRVITAHRTRFSVRGDSFYKKMALRNRPYLPLYIQDFLTDEKLIECSASATGIYIRLMCIMHKSEQYGKILLKQKDKQNAKQILNFALKVAKQLPYSLVEVESALTELINEGVLTIEGDFLVQKRMVKDAALSESRRNSGINGGKKTQGKIKDLSNNFALAKVEANSEYEDEDENDIVIDINNTKKSKIEKTKIVYPSIELFMGYGSELCKKAGLNYESLKFSLEAKFNAWSESGWKNGKTGKKILNWKTTLQSTLPHLKPIYNGNTTETNKKILGRNTAADLEGLQRAHEKLVAIANGRTDSFDFNL